VIIGAQRGENQVTVKELIGDIIDAMRAWYVNNQIGLRNCETMPGSKSRFLIDGRQRKNNIHVSAT
jgi:hypothetical protein